MFLLFFEKNKHICLKKATIYTFVRIKEWRTEIKKFDLVMISNKNEVNP